MRERGPAGEAWIDFPYNGGLDFANTASTQPLQYRMNFFGKIEMRGRCSKATGGAANDNIGTLPTGYVPPESLRFSVPHGTGQIVLAVQGQSAGSPGQILTVSAATASTIIDLSVISFYPT